MKWKHPHKNPYANVYGPIHNHPTLYTRRVSPSEQVHKLGVATQWGRTQQGTDRTLTQPRMRANLRCLVQHEGIGPQNQHNMRCHSCDILEKAQQWLPGARGRRGAGPGGLGGGAACRVWVVAAGTRCPPLPESSAQGNFKGRIYCM